MPRFAASAQSQGSNLFHRGDSYGGTKSGKTKDREEGEQKIRDWQTSRGAQAIRFAQEIRSEEIGAQKDRGEKIVAAEIRGEEVFAKEIGCAKDDAPQVVGEAGPGQKESRSKAKDSGTEARIIGRWKAHKARGNSSSATASAACSDILRSEARVQPAAAPAWSGNDRPYVTLRPPPHDEWGGGFPCCRRPSTADFWQAGNKRLRCGPFLAFSGYSRHPAG